MPQYFKCIYFSDYPIDGTTQKNVTLAFGERDVQLYEQIASLSSHELRNLIGYQSYVGLKNDADLDRLSINKFCIRLLGDKFKQLSPPPKQRLLPSLELPPGFNVDPIQTTFKGGGNEPLHSWYPYLEGYSPQFVEAIISHYSPHASRVLDPFSGTGTTALTAAKLGLQTYYCEVNPLLQYLTEIKSRAFALQNGSREQIRTGLEELADIWPTLIKDALPASDLAQAFSQVFGDSAFFDPGTFKQVLKARAVLDQLALTRGLIADLATIAVLGSLLSSSRLIRNGDVRYRTEKENDRKTLFNEEVIRRLTIIAEDLLKLGVPPKYDPVLIAEDARALDRVPVLNIESVITSPPYLNGTNYFRNTKIELWFLRCLKTKSQLANYRYRAVTAGINDVTVDKVQDRIPKPLIDVLRRLEESAYDSRIPKMVLSYFQDMETIFTGIGKHLVDGATVAVDLGDSVYGGIHVPTDRLLVDILKPAGFVLDDQVVLRKRLSRHKTELHQVLLVMRYEQKQNLKHKESNPSTKHKWGSSWTAFKNELPHQKQPFAKRNWGNPLHSLCSYQGKMKPSLAYNLVKTFVPNKGRILDPFAGVGTIPFEAALNGAEAFGFDISATALTIASAKVGVFDSRECSKLIRRLEHYLETQELSSNEYASASKVAFNGHIEDYFHPQTLREILLARRFFLENPPATSSQHLILASTLHILHGNRPYALSRRSHPITPYKPTGEFEYRSLVSRLKEKVERSLLVERPDGFVPGKMFYQDATQWWPDEVDQLDAIITSPPFFDSTRFHIGNWMRLWFCGWEREDFDTKPLVFVDERQKDSFSVYAPILRQARERLRPGGVVVFHLGLSHKSDMAKELSSIASEWFNIEDVFVEDVGHLESHGIRDKGTVTGHQYLILS